MSLRFHLVVRDVDPGNKYFVCIKGSGKMSLHAPRDGKVLLKIFCKLLKRDLTWKWGVSVCGICGRRQKTFCFCDLKLW